MICSPATTFGKVWAHVWPHYFDCTIGLDVIPWGTRDIENLERSILFPIHRWINYIDMSLKDVAQGINGLLRWKSMRCSTVKGRFVKRRRCIKEIWGFWCCFVDVIRYRFNVGSNSQFCYKTVIPRHSYGSRAKEATSITQGFQRYTISVIPYRLNIASETKSLVQDESWSSEARWRISISGRVFSDLLHTNLKLCKIPLEAMFSLSVLSIWPGSTFCRWCTCR